MPGWLAASRRRRGYFLTDNEGESTLDEPLVSVITVALNEKANIENTIRSVTNQTYDNIEYIVVDGGSNDGSLDIIKRYDDKIDYWVSEPDKGIFDGMNKGIKVARGEYLIFMNAGDQFFDEKVIADFVDCMKKKHLIICGDAALRYPDGFVRIHNAELNLYGMPTAHHSIFFSKEVFRAFGLYNLKYKMVADFDTWQRAYMAYPKKVSVKHRTVSLTNLEGVSSRYKYRICREKFIVDYNNLKGLSLISAILHTYLDFVKISVIYLMKKIGFYYCFTHWRYKSRIPTSV